jgi:hypothetical protein
LDFIVQNLLIRFKNFIHLEYFAKKILLFGYNSNLEVKLDCPRQTNSLGFLLRKLAVRIEIISFRKIDFGSFMIHFGIITFIEVGSLIVLCSIIKAIIIIRAMIIIRIM